MVLDAENWHRFMSHCHVFSFLGFKDDFKTIRDILDFQGMVPRR